MIHAALTGAYCNDCKAQHGQYNSQTKTWTFSDKCAPQAVIVVTSMTQRAAGQERAYCRYHQREAETWPDGKGGYIVWPLADQIAAAVADENNNLLRMQLLNKLPKVIHNV